MADDMRQGEMESFTSGFTQDQGLGYGTRGTSVTRGYSGRRGSYVLQRGRLHESGEGLATALGWFSIGLGLAELAAPRSVGRLIGLGEDDDTRHILIAAGLREIVNGVGILTNRHSAGWLQARVGGDAMDLAILGAALASSRSDKRRVIGALAAVLGVTALDAITAQRLSRNGVESGAIPYDEYTEPIGAAWRGRGPRRDGSTDAGRSKGIYVKKSITIRREPSEVYAFWRDFENLPTFMRHLEEVSTAGGTRSYWKAKAPAGTSVEWYAEIVDDRPNELISWRSIEGSDIPNSGLVSFKKAPRDQGTEVTVELRYDPPGGKLGKIVARLFGEEPGQQVRDDLFAFKNVMETGEVVVSDGSPGIPRLRTQKPGQPAKRPATV